jgi:hypothetical protein
MQCARRLGPWRSNGPFIDPIGGPIFDGQYNIFDQKYDFVVLVQQKWSEMSAHQRE